MSDGPRYHVRLCALHDIDGPHWHITFDGRDVPGFVRVNEAAAKAEAANLNDALDLTRVSRGAKP